MLRVAWKDLRARWRRLFTTSLAVVLGIAFLSGTQVLSAVLEDSIDDLVADIYAGYDGVVRSPQSQSVGLGQQVRAAVDADVVDRIAVVDGVGEAHGVVEARTAHLVGFRGGVVGGGDLGPPTAVVNWIGGDVQQGVMAAGRPPGTGEIALTLATAREAGYRLGHNVLIIGPAGQEHLELVGLVGQGRDWTRASGARTLFVSTPDAQRLAQIESGFSYVAVTSDGVVGDDQLTERLAAAVPELQVLTGDEFRADTAEGIAQFVGVMSTFITVFGYVSLFVACFIIYNTFSILVAQRTRETALLRAVGARRRQILAAVLVEALVVGAVASLLGLAGGVALATLFKGVAGRAFLMEPGTPSLPTSAVVLGVAVGLVVTTISALVPAWRATRVPPVAAMSEPLVDRSAVSLRRGLWGVALLVAGVALVVLGLIRTGPDPLVQLGLGAAVSLIAITLVLGPLVAAPTSRVIGRVIAPRGRVTGRLAGENAARNPRRTASTAAALTIGVTLVTLIAVVASSVRSSVEQAVTDRVTADYIVRTSGVSIGVGIPGDTIEQVQALEGVGLASAVRIGPTRVLDAAGVAAAGNGTEQDAVDRRPPGEDEFVLGIEPDTFFEVVRPGDVQGSLSDLGEGTFAAVDRIARERGWSIGDRVPFYFAQSGVQELQLVATIEHDFAQAGYFLPRQSFDPNMVPMFLNDMFVLVQAAGGASAAQLADLRAALEEIYQRRAHLAVQDMGEYAQSQTAPLDTFLAVVYGLLALAVIIALVGIANTVSLSVLERTRELGLLRAVGMSRRQLRRSILGESMIIAVFGTVSGLLLGVILSIALSAVIGAESPGLFRYSLPLLHLAVIAVVAALAGVLAAVLPAWRAARLEVLEAIAAI